MGWLTWAYEHHPEMRMNRVVYEMKQSPQSGVKQFVHESLGFGSDVSFVLGAFISRGQSLTGRTQTDIVLKQGIFYDPGVIDYRSTLGGQFAERQRRQIQVRSESIGILTNPYSGVSSQAKTTSGTKSSRGVKSPQTLKPFWRNGKPKCRVGYRYDFKRKLCVKKS